MNWPVIEVVIGLAFFFFLMSTIASALNELFASAFSLRARGLEQALVRMLGATHAKGFFATPVVAAVRKSDTKRGPSYLDPATFSEGLHQLIGHDGPGYAIDVSKVEHRPLREVLETLAHEVENDATRFRAAVEDWFDRSMARASGWYKRRIQAILLVIGLALAFGGNLSALTVGQRLWSDASLRAVVNAEAQRAVATTETTATGSPTTTPTTTAGPLQRAQSDYQSIHELGFPAGWGRANQPRGWGWLASIMGWIITAVAVSLGAPFWFDLLSKVVNLRASGAKPPPAGSATASNPAPSAAPGAAQPAPAPKSPPPALRGLIGPSNRSLVVTSATSLSGRSGLAWLYRLLDEVGPATARLELGSRYGSLQILNGRDVTRDGLVQALRNAATPACEAIDLLLMVHGEPDALVLAASGGSGTDDVAATDLARALSLVPELSGKLRLCYSTACYGASHAQALRGAGFRAVIGAKAINANSATEVPILLHQWAKGADVASALRNADDPTLRDASDFLARTLEHFSDANSEKILVGDQTITIDSLGAH